MSLRDPVTPPLAVFRCDASPDIGGGHFARCSALAAGLVRRGWRVGLAVRADTSASLQDAAALFDRIVFLEGEADDEAAEIGPELDRRADLVVVDHYRRGRRFESACRAWAERVLAISDMPDRAYDCDVLLDDSFGRAADAYEGLIAPFCRVLSGSRFALLNPAFAAARLTAVARREQQRPVSRLLVAMGAADADNVTGKALDAIAGSRLDCAIDVVLGAGAPHVEVIAKRLATLPQPARLHVNVGIAAVVELMTDADLAIGAGGTMSWERCCLGLPTLVITTGANQELHAANLAASGAVWLAGTDADVSAAMLRADLLALAADASARKRMSAAAASVCDGRGADRAAAALDHVVRGAPHLHLCLGDA